MFGNDLPANVATIKMDAADMCMDIANRRKFAADAVLFIFSDDCANADAAIDSAATSQKPRRVTLSID
jgi:hypothetical protein